MGAIARPRPHHPVHPCSMTFKNFLELMWYYSTHTYSIFSVQSTARIMPFGQLDDCSSFVYEVKSLQREDRKSLEAAWIRSKDWEGFPFK